MAATCPHCQYKVSPSMPRPGRFRLKCPRCQQPFALVIPEESAAAWGVWPITVNSAPLTLPSVPSAGSQATSVRTAIRPAPDVAADTGRHAIETPGPPPEPPEPPKRAPTPPRMPAGSVPGTTEHPALAKIPTHIPGYHIERVLGQGGMGTVFLGRQLSLDRPVAVKVMSKKWANDPVFVARFTREAYAAALLNHPNIVQIHDIGECDAGRFFVMEYVAGRSLADVIKSQGKVNPEVAVGYVLQAARGLKFAHDRGMIHRDVKPDNLLLDEQGVIKVADLGLVKTPGMDHEADRLPTIAPKPRSGLHALPLNMTGVRMALGTPAYMAPEQCRDAALVDHRADIYSLGCTLYALVCGRQPFDGTTAVELMTKHAYEPLVPPDVIVARLPKELSAVIQKMMAKDAGERYQTLTEVILTLEAWLGVHHAGSFSPRDDQIEYVERQARAFNHAPLAVLRGRAVAGFLAGCVLAAILFMFVGKLGWAFGLAGLVIQGALGYFVLNGVARKTYVFRRVRQFVLGLAAGDWGVALAGLGLFAVLLWGLGLFWVWVEFGLLGVALAGVLWFGLDRAIERSRRPAVYECERLLRRMRAAGISEEDIRHFVAKYAGHDWEEFFEAVFGYEEKLATRTLLLRGGSAGHRETFAAWRETLVGLIDRAEKARKDAREQKLLEQVEKARLIATGVNESMACDQAAAEAAEVVRRSNTFRKEGSRGSVAELLAPAGPTAFETAEPRDPLRWVVGLFVGPHVRAALAGLLVAGCGVWVYQNRLWADRTLAERATQAVESQNVAELRERAAAIDGVTMPLKLPRVPAEWTAWCDTLAAGWAGLLMFGSLFFRGTRLGLFVILGSAVMVLGHRFGIHTVEPIRDYHVSWLLGTVLCLIGYRMARR